MSVNGGRRTAEARWLRVDDLHPLDVVLCRSPHLRSKKTAWLAGGTFSHAAFVLDPTMWFDAQPAGCGMHSITNVEVGEDGFFLNLQELGKVRVLAHPIVPLLSEARQHELKATVENYCQTLIGCNYARYEELLPLVRRSGAAKVTKRWPRAMARLANVLDRLHAIFLAEPGTRRIRVSEAILCGHKSTPGHFCSELVVHLYETIGLDLSTDDTEYAPDDLANPTRSLLRVRDIVLHGPPDACREYKDAATDEHDKDLRQAQADIRDIEQAMRGLIGPGRVDRYLITGLQGKVAARKRLGLNDGFAALVAELRRLLELNKNLVDLHTQKPRWQHDPNALATLRTWCSLVQERLARDNPLPAATAEIMQVGLDEMPPADRAKIPAAQRLFDRYEHLLAQITKLHTTAQGLLPQILARTPAPQAY